jgi:hypothetical protein
MRVSRKMKPWVAGLLCLLAPFPAYTGDIVATGGWNRTIDSSDLTAGAGSDLTAAYESAANATSLDLTAVGDFRVDVRRTDGNWSGDLTLYVKRTQPGSGSGSISGGTSYQAVSTADMEFFTGNSDRTGIEVQYQVDGVSVSMSPDTYTSTVTFTIIDL